MTVREIFRPFIDGYLHRREAFPTANEVAGYFDAFSKEHVRNFKTSAAT